MTSQKKLKQLIRARMERTGERYTVAREHVVRDEPAGQSGWDLLGGVEPLTATFASVLANLGVVDPTTRAPLSEAMVLGIGGGLGAGYILWEFERDDSPLLVLGFTRRWQYPDRWASETADRLGLHAQIHETTSRAAAERQLHATLDRGLPAIVWADAQLLGNSHSPAWLEGRGGHPVVVYGRDGSSLLVDDRSRGRLTIDAGRVSKARSRIGSFKHRLIEIDPDLVAIDDQRMVDGVRSGLELQVEHLRARSDSFSLPAWRKWARLTTDTRNPKAWPRVFADGQGLAGVLASLYLAAGPTGERAGNLRPLYAEFLVQAASLLGRPALREVAGLWREAGRSWDALVDLALPLDRTPLGDLRRAIDRAEADRWRLQRELDEAFPMSAGDVQELFAEIGSRVRSIYDAEVEAVDALAAAIGTG